MNCYERNAATLAFQSQAAIMEKNPMSKMKRAMEKKAEKEVEKQIEKQKLKLPTTTYDNPWLEAAAEAGNPFGKLLKFVKGCVDDR